MRLERHEQRIVCKPGVLLRKGIHFFREALARPRKGPAQRGVMGCDHTAVIHARRVGAEIEPGKIVLSQNFLFKKQAKIHKVRVARKRGKRLIGRITIARRPNRQHLPDAHLRIRNKVRKRVGGTPHRADPIRRRQRADMHQYTAFSHGTLLIGNVFILEYSVAYADAIRNC